MTLYSSLTEVHSIDFSQGSVAIAKEGGHKRKRVEKMLLRYGRRGHSSLVYTAKISNQITELVFCMTQWLV